MRVEVWSDVVCPWCFLGRHRLDAAIAQFAHRDEVEVVSRSFELHPDAPRDGEPRGAPAADGPVVAAAAAEGLALRLDRARPANTFDAHRLLHLATAHGRQQELEERLMRAHLMEGEPVGVPSTLERLATEAGLPPSEVRALLESDRYADAVRADELLARSVEIFTVPFFTVDRDLAVSGAQPADVLLELLQQSWDRARRRAAGGPAAGPS